MIALSRRPISGLRYAIRCLGQRQADARERWDNGLRRDNSTGEPSSLGRRRIFTIRSAAACGHRPPATPASARRQAEDETWGRTLTRLTHRRIIARESSLHACLPAGLFPRVLIILFPALR